MLARPSKYTWFKKFILNEAPQYLQWIFPPRDLFHAFDIVVNVLLSCDDVLSGTAIQILNPCGSYHQLAVSMYYFINML